jgi:MscS family membrane protein
VDISSLLTGLGLGGLAFALAAQDTVKNLFGSLTVLLDKPFNVGDWVKIGDLEGTVEEVGFRTTRIRTFYNSLITMPNANLISTAVDNLGARTYRRWKTMLSLTYDTPPEKFEEFCEGIRELVRKHPDTRKDYFHVYANEFGAASLDVLVYVFFRTPGWGEELGARHTLFLDILRLARDLGVEFAFPTQTLHVHASDWTAAKHDLAPDAVERAMAEGKERAGAIAGARETTS